MSAKLLSPTLGVIALFSLGCLLGAEPPTESGSWASGGPSDVPGDDGGDFGDPNESSDGTLWACTFVGEGYDGWGNWYSFEDSLDFCFDDGDHAQDFTDSWVQDCRDAFDADGYTDIYCDATCGNTEAPC